MPAVMSPTQAATKWARVTQTRQEDYRLGVENPRKDWHDATVAAEPSYKAGIQKSVAEGTWKKGVARAGTAKWRENAIAKGPGRWAEGINGAQAAYESGFRPYAEVLARTTLPPRGPKGDPKNIQRVAVIADTLHKTKLSLGG